MMKTLLFVGLGRMKLTVGKDGGSIRAYEFLKFLKNKDIKATILIPERDIINFKNYKVKGDFLPLKEKGFWYKSEVSTYLIRTLRASIFLGRLERKFDVVFSGSDFFHDVIPAIFYKITHPRTKFVSAFLLIAPNPFRGYELSFKGGFKFPRFRGLLYFISQRIIIRLLGRLADLVLVLNSSDELELEKLGINPSKIKVTSMGIDHNFIDLIASPKKIYDGCFLGRICAQKGLPDLIKIWKLICKKNPKATLVIVGGATEKWGHWLRSEIKKNKLEKNVFYLGPKEGEEKFKLLKSSKIFIYPTYYDSWGQVIAEAMAAELPVVTYNLPVFKEIFQDRITSIPSGEIERFAAEINNLLSNKNHRDKVAKRGLVFIKRYDWENVFRGDFKFLNRLYAGRQKNLKETTTK
jgi:glycosyltransferase involved in cell wall biosynthesis